MSNVVRTSKAKITKTSSYKWSIATAVLVIVVYLLDYKYHATSWFELSLPTLLAAFIYVCVLFHSFIFGISHAKIYSWPYLPMGINIGIALVAYILPSSKLNKEHYESTMPLLNTGCDCKLYVENYMVAVGGISSGNLDSMYLMDSLSFRRYIGTFDEMDGEIVVKCQSDKITVDSTTYSIKDLKLTGIFE